MSVTYHFAVDQAEGKSYQSLYRGADVAEAMAAWSKAIAEGREYVMLEALRETQS